MYQSLVGSWRRTPSWFLILVLPPADSMFPLRPARNHCNQYFYEIMVVYMLDHATHPDVTHNAALPAHLRCSRQRSNVCHNSRLRVGFFSNCVRVQSCKPASSERDANMGDSSVLLSLPRFLASVLIQDNHGSSEADARPKHMKYDRYHRNMISPIIHHMFAGDEACPV